MLPDRQVTIGGKAFTLRFSLKAIAALQEIFGTVSLSETVARLSDFKSHGALDWVGIFWAGCISHHPDLTIQDVMTLLDENGIDAAIEPLTTAFTASLPSTDDAPANPQTPRKTDK